MDINNYDELLDKAYEKIPENARKLSRFEIPKVELRIESRNTFITNFNKIISTLNRDRKHFLGVFLKKAGTMGEVRGQQLFLKGQYKDQVLNKLIENYTKMYVLCRICNKPDTQIQREGKKLYLKCTACGAREEIKEK
ncbi:MAG: translation initiation factor IF-2 subunit beta [Candidatus Lokiarchaeota archaeon]|nr:translation initiation factor IF-2 subunit beta [Candidatus Lokiarchaeota archaeon]MCK4779341.1 translation initiation factor IF-2 subunit beta [Candidatus Lokiarchaeota archaeon]